MPYRQKGDQGLGGHVETFEPAELLVRLLEHVPEPEPIVVRFQNVPLSPSPAFTKCGIMSATPMYPENTVPFLGTSPSGRPSRVMQLDPTPSRRRLIRFPNWMSASCVLHALTLIAWPVVSGAESTTVSVSVFSTGMRVDPTNTVVCAGERVTWRSEATIFVPPAETIEVVVPAGPFGGPFHARVAIGTPIVSPPAVDTAVGSTTAYTLRVYNSQGALIRQQTGLTIRVDCTHRQLFDRLNNRLAGLPSDVSKVLETFTDAAFETILACPDGSQDQRVRLRVETAVEPWDSKLAGTDVYGLYRIGKPQSSEVPLKGGGVEKLVLFKNELRLNCTDLLALEGATSGEIHNEVVLYHELLHGEMFVDRAVAEVKKQLGRLCASEELTSTDELAGDTDADHKAIDPLEDRYIENNRQRGIVFERIVISTRQRVFLDEIKVQKDLKQNGRIRCWRTKNVKTIRTETHADVDRVFIFVEVEGNGPAVVKCLIDPPDLLVSLRLIFGESAEIPLLGGRELTLLASLLALSGFLLILRRHRRAAEK